MQIQYRLTTDAEMTADAETRQISGYGIVFDSDSLPLTVEDGNGGTVRVIEQISQRSIQEADMTDVLSAYNHNFEKVLGRTTSNTLNLKTDKRGVKYTVRVGNQTYATDLLESLQRGDVAGSSFVFTYDPGSGYEFRDRADGTLIAIPRKITKIFEMGPVTNPAYPETTAENRSAELQKAVQRHLKGKQEEAAQEETEEEEPRADVIKSRAMDVMDMSEAVVTAFYREFDGKEEYGYAYYYVQSVMLDNTLVAKESSSKTMWKLGFSIGEDMTVTFDSRESWEQVQKEFVPVRAWEEKEVQKRETDEAKEAENRVSTTGYPARYYQIKAITKKRV